MPSAKYHPAVRYNAVLIIGMLDKTYAAPGRPPVPLPEGFVKLHTILDAAVKGKQVAPFLVVGALVGLQRHAASRIARSAHARRDDSTNDHHRPTIGHAGRVVSGH